MKPLSTTLILIGAIALLAFTNPTLDEYSVYARHHLLNQSDSQDVGRRDFDLAFGGIASYFVENASRRTNYVLFSVFHTDLGSRHMRCLGALGNFFACASRSDHDRGEQQE